MSLPGGTSGSTGKSKVQTFVSIANDERVLYGAADDSLFHDHGNSGTSPCCTGLLPYSGTRQAPTSSPEPAPASAAAL